MQSILTEDIDAMDSFFSPRHRLSEPEAKQIYSSKSFKGENE
jgi:hypothetical protein